MNIYELSRRYWDWSFENPDKVKPNHSAMYFFAIEHCNRLGWKTKFGFPTTMVMEAIGIKSYNTFISTLNDLAQWGFIKVIERSKNQYSANIVAISNFDEAHNNALNEALMRHTTKQSESIDQSTVESIDSIDKPTYNTTNLQTNNLTTGEIQEFPQESFSSSNNEDSDFLKPPEATSKKVASKNILKNKKKYFSATDFKKMLLSLDVDEKDADTWIEIRRQKRAVYTENVIKVIRDECEKYNFSFPNAIKACADYGWQGFEYEWYLNKQKTNGQSNHNNSNNGYSNRTGNTSMGQGGKISAATLLAERARKQATGNGYGGNFTTET
ncbi:MAG: hypothetical protein L0G07_09025 [Chryseobacterium sp.]|nr:hypothetical protein [Chryseobacterium sp.]MDN5423533.1 hypothetical protein [Chryseobacterium sp.]MDN5470368.1 hypothetical protein [Lactococcus lactis]MDN5481123.1 hypothetical protein [Chryseobacterium sp.]